MAEITWIKNKAWVDMRVGEERKHIGSYSKGVETWRILFFMPISPKLPPLTTPEDEVREYMKMAYLLMVGTKETTWT